MSKEKQQHNETMDIEFCDSKPQQEAAGGYAPPPSQELPDSFEEIEGPDEDLPF